MQKLRENRDDYYILMTIYALVISFSLIYLNH
jgi:hypothetical protein